MKEYMTCEELKAYFGIDSDQTVRNWEKDGLKAIYITQKTKFFWCEDVREFMNKKRRNT